MFPKVEISNRRSGDRVALRASAVLGLSDGRVIPARTLDIGKGGAGVVCDLNLIVGAVVSIRMNLPSNSPVGAVFEATATVANCTLSNKDGGFRLGLQFNPLSAAAASALRAVAP
jgi:hypothetical protein